MGALIEAVVFLLAAVAVVGAIVVVARGGLKPSQGALEPRQRTVPERHEHRWTKWQVIDERKIHLYGEVDEGRDLPDRIDVVMRRECAICGLPQTQTVRGLDPMNRG